MIVSLDKFISIIYMTLYSTAFALTLCVYLLMIRNYSGTPLVIIIPLLVGLKIQYIHGSTGSFFSINNMMYWVLITSMCSILIGMKHYYMGEATIGDYIDPLTMYKLFIIPGIILALDIVFFKLQYPIFDKKTIAGYLYTAML